MEIEFLHFMCEYIFNMGITIRCITFQNFIHIIWSYMTSSVKIMRLNNQLFMDIFSLWNIIIVLRFSVAHIDGRNDMLLQWNSVKRWHKIPIYLRSILILSFRLLTSLPSGLISSDFAPKTVYAFLFSPHAWHMSFRLTLVRLITPIIVMMTNHEVPQYSIVSSLMLISSSAPYSLTDSAFILSFVWDTIFHIHAKKYTQL
jgi:hypothetical protein